MLFCRVNTTTYLLGAIILRSDESAQTLDVGDLSREAGEVESKGSIAFYPWFDTHRNFPIEAFF